MFLFFSDLSVHLDFALTEFITGNMLKHTELYAFSWSFHVQFLFDEQTHFLIKKLLCVVFPPG